MPERRSKTLLLVAAPAVALLGYHSLRAKRHISETKRLIQKSLTFPMRYSVGSGQPIRYVSLGDSTASGVGVHSVEETLPYLFAEHLAERGLRVDVTNFGNCGAKIADVLERQIPDLPAGPIDLVTLSISANDATRGTDTFLFRAQLRAVLEELEHRRAPLVLLTTTPNFRTSPALPSAIRVHCIRRSEKLTQIVREIASDYPFVELVPLNEDGSLTPGECASDGFHPSVDGYHMWAVLFDEAYSRRLASAPLPRS
ncbi:MAG TPA: SGNH/GDSL hydrolase family protein [Fimbriimonas sp.]|nr:SGNH/GDSL hydrolase family protein [Fimbriimonas sp.]